MPKMNGLELLRKVREKYPGTIRMLITAYSDITVAKDAINKVDVDYYIEKPWDNAELRELVSEALKRKYAGDLGKTKSADGMGDDIPLSLMPMLSNKEK
jgi:response regulator RpfG family c-di-GMP phosphodiesterase